MAGAFGEQPRILTENDDFTVTAFRYASGDGGLKIQSSRGHLGDSATDGADDLRTRSLTVANLTMRNMFPPARSRLRKW